MQRLKEGERSGGSESGERRCDVVDWLDGCTGGWVDGWPDGRGLSCVSSLDGSSLLYGRVRISSGPAAVVRMGHTRTGRACISKVGSGLSK